MSSIASRSDQADFSISSETLTITPQDRHEPILEAIETAQKTLDIVNFHLSDMEVVRALIEASQRGVQVRIILDSSILSKNIKAQNIADELKKSDVQVKPSSNKFSITHEKTLVIDNKLAFITTINLVTTSASTRDFGLITQDPDVIAEINSVFNADWSNADSNGDFTPSLSQSRLVWSPINSTQKLKELIQSAQSTIDLDVENFGDKEIQDALIARAIAGVQIRTLTPGCIPGDNPLRNRQYLEAMGASGIQNRVMAAISDSVHPYMHAKMIIVDNKTFYIGSENFSYNSLEKARELGIITDNNELSTQLENVFAQDWQESVSPDQVTKEDCDEVQKAFDKKGDVKTEPSPSPTP
ncbi:MAG: phospholipase D-like domain-containing protein [Pseudobdellovibrionaceae bacterium]